MGTPSTRTAIGALALLGAVLLACAGASHTQLGGGLYSITCKRSQANCHEEAAAVCPYGFDVQDSSSQDGAIVHTNMNGDQAHSTVTPTHKGTLLVRCREPAPKQ